MCWESTFLKIRVSLDSSMVCSTLLIPARTLSLPQLCVRKMALHTPRTRSPRRPPGLLTLEFSGLLEVKCVKGWWLENLQAAFSAGALIRVQTRAGGQGQGRIA